MQDIQIERATTEVSEQPEGQQAQEAPAALVARLLANPRRVRRN